MFLVNSQADKGHGKIQDINENRTAGSALHI